PHAGAQSRAHSPRSLSWSGRSVLTGPLYSRRAYGLSGLCDVLPARGRSPRGVLRAVGEPDRIAAPEQACDSCTMGGPLCELPGALHLASPHAVVQFL